MESITLIDRIVSEQLLSQPATVVLDAKLWCAIPVSQLQTYSASRGVRLNRGGTYCCFEDRLPHS